MFNSQDQYAELNRLQQRANSGARWFYWIAALSLINSIAYLSGSKWTFIIGLGTTQLVNVILGSDAAGTAGRAIAIVFDLLATGLFAGFGLLAGKRYLWSYVVGGVLFALDSLIYVWAQDWIGIGFHVFATYCIFAGFVACRKFLALKREVEALAAAEAAEALATTEAAKSLAAAQPAEAAATALATESSSNPALPSSESA